jgi:2-C-methyl-D-erythritol 4-phosphate cytidylyltransferase/2-C-methyl-D-erythritol 2,4-cyclodiphosphate synthase
MTYTAAAIIPAAGIGSRMKLKEPKQFHPLAGIPILIHTLRPFLAIRHIHQVVVVVSADKITTVQALLADYFSPKQRKKIQVVRGGKRRQDSVRAGLESIDPATDIVLVHDGARPLVSREIIEKCCHAILRDGAAITAVPVKDTIKKINKNHVVTITIDRRNLYHAQTPQGARLPLLQKGFERLEDRNVTDESALLELAGIPVTIVEGAESNFKITRPEDLFLAEKIMEKKREQTTMRIGHGFDAHRFADNRQLVLGGITVPHEQGLAGHSDADVLTHALCDAILGALGAGDIGHHFPDSDKQFKNIYSIVLLEKVMEEVCARSCFLVNADITVVCQAPKLAPFLAEMKKLLARCCGVDEKVINIKATTTEKMGFTGRKEGISCHAVVLLSSN